MGQVAFPRRADYSRKGRKGARGGQDASHTKGSRRTIHNGGRLHRGGPTKRKLLFRLGGGFGSVGFEFGVVGPHILKGLGDLFGRFFGGGGDLIGGLDGGGVEFGGEVGLNLLQFVDCFREFGADGADLFVHLGVLFLGFVQTALTDRF